jgi:hypothetical protein
MRVAVGGGVDFQSKAAMNCPHCRERVEPLDGSTAVIAWYSCEHCGHFWSARLRNGQPVPDPDEGLQFRRVAV